MTQPASKRFVFESGLTSATAAVTSAAAIDATTKVANAITAHLAATDPHGDRAYTNAQITAALNGLINSAPGTLDTLGEIATQLSNDESAAGALTTLVNAIRNYTDPTLRTALSGAFAPALASEIFVKATGDPTADATAINNALLAASQLARGGRVRLSGDAWSLGSALTPRSGVTLTGSPGTTVTSTAVSNLIYGQAIAFDGFTVENITFLGLVNQFPTVPTRNRTVDGPKAQTAIYLSGDLDTTDTGQAVLRNFTMRNCIVKNMAALPIRVGGVRGKVSVTGCDFINNQDAGFLFCEDVVFNSNYVYGGSDNGVSLSRGCQKITCVGNTIENVAHNGIWITGFFSDKGPQDCTVVGNTIRNFGHNGVIADYAPKNCVIVGNVIDGGYYRGPVDNLVDSEGSGVFIGSFPVGTRTAPTDFATNIVVQGNAIRNMARTGVYVAGAKALAIHGNVITDVGTQFLSNGTTAIAASDATTNVGILIDYTTTATNVSVQGNLVTDTRATPFCNWAQQPISPASTWTYWLNQMVGCRNVFSVFEGNSANTREVTGIWRFDANTKAVGGITTGTGSATGDVVGFDANGAAGSRRGFKVLSGGVTRWWLRGNGTAETGGGTNSGSDLELAAYADDGTTSLGVVLSATRATAAPTLGSSFTVPVTIKGRRVASAGAATIGTGATSTAASATGGGANDSSGTVGATISGTPTAASVATVTYSTAYTAVPKVVISPRNAASAACQLYVTSEGTGGFTVAAGVAPGAGASVSFSYHVEG